ncbi:hypothetical protein F4859DRAFT_519621 [Xylaria cf. heliscus]|nr:hypothetical protein F4859DRAFT_519621 [Xylaria cf. heliscus]
MKREQNLNCRKGLGRARANSEKPIKRKRRRESKHPGIRTPAGILAALILAHPDDTLKDRVRRPEIDWMRKQPRNVLQVTDGFWNGLNANNIENVFTPSAAGATLDRTHRNERAVFPCNRNLLIWRARSARVVVASRKVD